MYKELRTEISGDNVNPKLGHTAGEDAIATSDLQYRFAGLQIEQAFSRWTDEETMEVVAIAHSLVPEGGFLIPHGACFFIQIDGLRCDFGSHRW